MSILTSIVNAILAIVGEPLSHSEMEAALDRKAAIAPDKLDWRNSIVDLMKLVGMDSSLENRERLAAELGYQGHFNGDAQMNLWLHERVMEHLSETLSRN